MEEVVTLEEGGRETGIVFTLQEPEEKFFSQFWHLGLGSVFRGVLVQTILFTQFNGLFPSVVTLIQIRGNPSELNQLVLLQSLCQ